MDLELGDTERDALALVAAVAREDMEAVEVIMDNADCRDLAGSLAAMVASALELGGVDDPAEWIAQGQRAVITDPG